MKAYFISDNVDTFVGLKFSGMDGILVHKKEEVLEVLNSLKDKKDIGIIILTQKIAALIPQKVSKMKLSKMGPLIVEIPDRHGSLEGQNSIIRYVKESIGLKI